MGSLESFERLFGGWVVTTILLPSPDGPSAQVSTKAGELHRTAPWL
jgi:hypothetical protein